MSNKNIITSTDSYKMSHWVQYPDDVQYVYSYIAPRGGVYDDVVVFGISEFVREYLLTPITQADIDFAHALATIHGEPFNRAAWERIHIVHSGYLPVSIIGVPEGSVVGNRDVIAVVFNTDPEFPWLTSYIETALLRSVWYGSTVASRSFNLKKIVYGYLNRTSDEPDGEIAFKVHDFGARGVSSSESACIGGAAHLINFMGTDTVEAVAHVARHYTKNNDVVGFSIPASEHSTICSWGKSGEIDAFRNMLTQFGGKYPLIACVSDTYDIFNAVDNLWGDALKSEVMNSGSMLVVRPDSGDPVAVNHQIIESLGKSFGYTVNTKGFKVLNNVRIIQGDGVDEHTIHAILGMLEVNGWSASNIAFGTGGYLLQQVNRDLLNFAMKASAVKTVEGWRDIFKDPVTSKGKSSYRGLVIPGTAGAVLDSPLTTIQLQSILRDYYHVYYTHDIDPFETDNGLMMFDEIRANASTAFKEAVRK